MHWTKNPIHLKAVAVIMLIRGALLLLFALFLFTIYSLLLHVMYDFLIELGLTDDIIVFIEALLGIVRFIFVSFALFNVAGGILLYQRHEAGRIIGIIVSIITVFNFPVGTALSIYSLIILFESSK
jgi:hypothetical protein